ncbi:MAG TPA: HAMP domain-containing sensor histidine kinase [Eoetvoesiella sp.]
MKSIAKRIHRAIFAISLASISVMVLTILFVNEDLEHTMLQVEFAEERDFFLGRQDHDVPAVWETANLTVVYIPAQAQMPSNMPAVFNGLKSSFNGEIERGKETFLVTIGPTEKGHLYIAKNITHFEDRESLFMTALGVIIVGMVLLTLLLAIFSSRRIITPLRRLSDEISSVPVGQNMPRLALNYQDTELHTVAATFNRFLDELESFVKREQSLLNLASHELRTPIAVISGALDIVEQRNQLTAADKTTIARIRRAADEMGSNVNMLLSLARRDTINTPRSMLSIVELCKQALEDLNELYDAQQRVTLIAPEDTVVSADPVMAQMLLRNLIQNALQHTVNPIQIRLSAGLIQVIDHGAGLTLDQQAILKGDKRLFQDHSALGGLGLYIVTLMCERLQWELDVAETTASGTVIHIRTEPGEIPL